MTLQASLIIFGILAFAAAWRVVGALIELALGGAL